MIATERELYVVLEDEGIIESLRHYWEGDDASFQRELSESLGILWEKYVTDAGFVSYEDLENIQQDLVENMSDANVDYIDSYKTVASPDDTLTQRKEKAWATSNYGFSMNEEMLSEAVKGLTKKEVEKIVKDEIAKAVRKETKDYLTKKEVKDMIRKTIVKQYKFLWEKSAFFVNNI